MERNNYKINKLEQEYEKEFQKYYDSMSKAIIGFNVAQLYIFYGNRQIREDVHNLFMDIVNAKSSQEAKKKKIILDEFFESKFGPTCIVNMDPDDLRPIVEQEMDNYCFDCDNKLLFDICDGLSKKVAKNPIRAMIDYLEMYIKAREDSERLNERRINDIKKIKNNKSTYSEESYSLFASSYNDYSRPPIPIELTPDNIQKEVNASRINNNGTVEWGLSKHIFDFFKKSNRNHPFSNLNKFYSQRNINNIFNFNSLSNRNTGNTIYELVMKYYDMVRLGELACNISYADLISGLDFYAEVSDLAKFMAQFNPHEILKQYEKQRKKFIKMYNRLAPEEKQEVDRAIQSDKNAKILDEYREKFGISDTSGSGIATVDQIKGEVNRQIMDYYYDQIRTSDDYNNSIRFSFIPSFSLIGDPQTKHKFMYSLKYMSVDEIANLYLSLRDNQFSKQSNDSKAMLQLTFAKTIRDRINGSKKIDELVTPFNNNNDVYLAQIEKELIAICKDYFSEYPLFETSFIKPSDVEDGYAIKKMEESNRLFFGMNKFQAAYDALKLLKYKIGSKMGNPTDDDSNEFGKRNRR